MLLRHANYVFMVDVLVYSLHLLAFTVHLPAGVSLAAAGVDTLRQSVMQTGINHIQTDGLLMHLAAGVSAQHTQS